MAQKNVSTGAKARKSSMARMIAKLADACEYYQTGPLDQSTTQQRIAHAMGGGLVVMLRSVGFSREEAKQRQGKFFAELRRRQIRRWELIA